MSEISFWHVANVPPQCCDCAEGNSYQTEQSAQNHADDDCAERDDADDGGELSQHGRRGVVAVIVADHSLACGEDDGEPDSEAASGGDSAEESGTDAEEAFVTGVGGQVGQH